MVFFEELYLQIYLNNKSSLEWFNYCIKLTFSYIFNCMFLCTVHDYELVFISKTQFFPVHLNLYLLPPFTIHLVNEITATLRLFCVLY